MKKIFSPSYWFDLMPGSPNLFFWKIILVCAVLTVIIAIISIFFQKKYRNDNLKRKTWYRLTIWGFSAGPVMAVLAFFRFQYVQLFSMRAWIFIWLAIVIWWLASILRYSFLVMPKKIAMREEKKEFDKYLPKKK